MMRAADLFAGLGGFSEGARQAGMSFPPSYLLPARRREAIHMLGNAVPPLMARAVLAEVRRTA